VKKRSIQDFIWFIILLVYAVAFLFLIISGKILDFLHPRMLIFTTGAMVVFFLLAGCQLVRFLQGTRTPAFRKGFLIFILPLLFGFVARNIDTSTALAAARGSDPGQTINPAAMSQRYTDVDVRTLLQQEVIDIKDESYYKIQFILYENVELFSGKDILVTGFLYRDSEFNSGFFLCARYIMWCCAADAVLSGYVSEYPGAETLEPEVWLRVYGTLETTSFFNSSEGRQKTIPKIRVKNIEYIDPPRLQYIFAR
jgi:putative membrane protein